MNDVNVFEFNNQLVMDSRLVAEMVDKKHKELLRDIRSYIAVMRENVSNERNFAPVDFFIPSEYVDSKGETRPCYLLTKMGCEMVANKLTGTKGVLFTATYVSEFNRMEQLENRRQMISERQDFGEIASVMREFRLWAKCARVPYGRALEEMTQFFHNTGVPFPEGMSNQLSIKAYPAQIALWSKEDDGIMNY